MTTTISLLQTELKHFKNSYDYAKNKKEQVVSQLRDHKNETHEIQKLLLNELVNDLLKGSQFSGRETWDSLNNFVSYSFYPMNYQYGINCWLRTSDFNTETPLDTYEKTKIMNAHKLFFAINENLEFLSDAISTCFTPQQDLQMERQILDDAAVKYNDLYYKSLKNLSRSVLKQGIVYNDDAVNNSIPITANKWVTAKSVKMVKETPKQWHIEVESVYGGTDTYKVSQQYLHFRTWINEKEMQLMK